MQKLSVKGKSEGPSQGGIANKTDAYEVSLHDPFLALLIRRRTKY